VITTVVRDRRRFYITLGMADWWLPLAPITIDIFDRLADKLMVIGPVIAQDVIRYFGFVRSLTKLQGMMTEYEHNEQDARFQKQYLEELRKQSARGQPVSRRARVLICAVQARGDVVRSVRPCGNGIAICESDFAHIA
jgi:hypothetical protein